MPWIKRKQKSRCGPHCPKRNDKYGRDYRNTALHCGCVQCHGRPVK